MRRQAVSTVSRAHPAAGTLVVGGGAVAFVVRRRSAVVGAVLAALTAAAAVVSLGVGSTFIPPAEVVRALAGDGPFTVVVQDLRMPRIAVGLAVGALLGLSGALLQSISRNPLASPDVVGVTQGAGLAATVAMSAGLGTAWLGAGALLGGLAAAAAVFALSLRYGLAAHRFVLCGVAVAVALKALMPDVRIIGVQAAGCSPLKASLEAGHPVAISSARTIADGIAVKRPGDLTLPLIRDLVDDVVTVDDDEIAWGITYIVQNSRLVVEGAGAAGVAALLARKVTPRPNERVCVIMGGGNIDGNMLARVIEQVLVKQGRYILVRTTVDDRPGNLAPLISRVASAGANVVDIFHRRAVWLAPVDRVGIEMVLEVRDEEHGQAVIQHLAEGGYVVEREGQGLWPG